ncbi:MAG TPA: response regulator [Phototrophicaceae bacterium]|nr:response regulator [Phototrophicaceae bacterium]
MPLSNVLVLDDDQDMREILHLSLEGIGCTVDKAATINEARQYMDQTQYDALIIDMRLKGERGIDLLRECSDLLSRMHVIAVSAEDQYRQPCEEIGVEFFISKPLSPIMLNRLIERLDPKM